MACTARCCTMDMAISAMVGASKIGLQWQVYLEGITYAGHDPDSLQRMPSQGEEVIVYAHLLQAKEVRPHL